MVIVPEIAVIVVAVPLVIVLDTAMFAIPVTGEELTAVVPRSHPVRPRIVEGPISVVPLILCPTGYQ